ncbi:MAG: T9SS type A sorting domain-containing protein [Bacteroidota bacterium]
MRFIFFIGILFLFVHTTAFGWGYNTHRYINKNAVTHLPPTMQRFIDSVAYLEKHSTDPDSRRDNSDTSFFSEQYRHYLDIDDYPNFRHMPRDLDSLIAVYGWSRVKENGVLYWATQWVMDSLTAQMKRNDWTSAFQTAADLGHYVADAHQPLHVTINYNGKFTGNYGIHSRYESTMMNSYLSSITTAQDTARYIKDPSSYIFDYLLYSNSYVDSVLAADRFAAPPSGYNGTGTLPADYYAKMWQHSQRYTRSLIQQATIVLANLWYTSFVNSGLLNQTNVRKDPHQIPAEFHLRQNYPNPFNPATKIEFDIPQQVHTTLEIFSVDGKLVEVLVNAPLEKGSYSAEWDAHHAPSGLYFYRLTAGNFSATKKLVIVK